MSVAARSGAGCGRRKMEDEIELELARSRLGGLFIAHLSVPTSRLVAISNSHAKSTIDRMLQYCFFIFFDFSSFFIFIFCFFPFFVFSFLLGFVFFAFVFRFSRVLKNCLRSLVEVRQ